jgi:hypothetical protein
MIELDHPIYVAHIVQTISIMVQQSASTHALVHTHIVMRVELQDYATNHAQLVCSEILWNVLTSVLKATTSPISPPLRSYVIKHVPNT